MYACEWEDVQVSMSEENAFGVLSYRDPERGPSLIIGHISVASSQLISVFVFRLEHM